VSKVVIINGFPGSGKDTFVNMALLYWDQVYNIHTSDGVKGMLWELGWDGSKTPQTRKLLADMLGFAYANNAVFKFVAEEVKAIHMHSSGKAIIFVHCREYANVQALKLMFNATTLFIDRNAAESVAYSNSSDLRAGEHKEKYDTIVYNNGSLKILEYNALAYLTTLIGGKKYDVQL